MTADLVDALRTELADIAAMGDEIPERYLRDWSGLAPVRPLALLRPRSTDQVAAALRLCSRLRVPVVPQGGLTGLAGGAHPIANGVVLALDRMRDIEEIDPVMATMTVQAGVTLGAVQAAADEAGLFFGVDLGARDSCTIGGVLSTNAGGNRVIRFGMARESVLGLEVVLADGTVMRSLNKMLKNNAGYDIKQMFIGSEGTLGIITRAVLRLQAKPEATATAFCGCADFSAVLHLLRKARSRMGPSLSSFEVMWPSFYHFMTSSIPQLRRPFVEPHGVYVLIESIGRDDAENTAILEELMAGALQAPCVADAVIARSERDAKDLWAVRESVSEYSRLMGPLTAFDIGLATSAAGDFVREIEDTIRGRWADAIVLSYGHIGDSNLHLVCNVPSAGAAQPHSEITDIVFGAVGRADGTISAEHGIGLLKKAYLPLSRSPEELALMATMKRALDPNNILNTGKVLSV
ncbi:FAD/FMN-containing dehydrogenase [Rhizobiales bacterium GAS191]|nr:FAD/FMN-containing dehydrogenase [Rhizobiales bacterium GAS191]